MLLVEPRWGRRGHAGRLLAAAAAALRANGARYGLAWIPEQDGASRGFYARAGWGPDGAVRALDTGNGIVREVRVTGSLDLKLQPERPDRRARSDRTHVPPAGWPWWCKHLRP